MAREGVLITRHPLLIQKTLADKLSDKAKALSTVLSDPAVHAQLEQQAVMAAKPLSLAEATNLVAARRSASFRDLNDFAARLPGKPASVDPSLFSVASNYFLVTGRITIRAATLQVNALVVRDGDDITLIDAGTAKGTYDTVGFFLNNLKNAGIDAAAVNRVALTHLHFDHVGFLFDAEGKPYFPNAEIVLSEAEYAYWNADSPDLSHVGADQGTKDFFVKAAKTAIANMQGRYTLKNDGQEIAPGLQMLAAPGHTPGHFAVLMEGFAYLADTFVHPWIHLPHPEWTSKADSDPATGVASRTRILDMVAVDGLLVSGSHANFPSLGRIEKLGSGYGWQAIPFEWA